MQILFQSVPKWSSRYPTFQGKKETFWKHYREKNGDIPLKDTISKSIDDDKNLLGEGLCKKVYNLDGLKNYIVRIYKNNFKKEDLDKQFTKPSNEYINTIDEVVLCIPNKIDITKKKSGKSLGLIDFSERIEAHKSPPLQNVYVKREETLEALELYEQIKEFPLNAYQNAYKQVKKFCKKPGYQFDVISPNNILIDTKSKKINLIDPIGPEINNHVHNKVLDFSTFHGADSLYPVLCDFLLQKEHRKNLSNEELERWDNAINTIISKCITAGEKNGEKRNIEELNDLYKRIGKFWQTKDLEKRYNEFIQTHSGAITPSKTISEALDYKINEKQRIEAIKKLYAQNFEELKPIFEKIIEAPHRPKVEYPEILNATLDKIETYGENSKTILPTLEQLFDKEIFTTTKQRLYNIFIKTEPNNERFLREISKSANNPFERTLYKSQIKELRNHPKIKKNNKHLVENLYKKVKTEKSIPQFIVDKLWMSRTCANVSDIQKISLHNMTKAYKYIETKKQEIPQTKDLIHLHKLVLQNTPGQEDIAGRIRTPEKDDYFYKKIFKITKDLKKTVNDYTETKDIPDDLKKLDKYIKENYNKLDTFILAANIFEETIRIHPFYNGNGRSTRLFTEQFLLSKGYRLTRWPEEALYRKIYSKEELAQALKENAVTNKRKI